MKKTLLSAAAFAVVAVSAVAVAPTTSEAVPAFARQTGAECLSCHFQAIPKLATMGRNFSLSGMRDMGEGSLIGEAEDGLSLPTAFNASFLMKIRARNSSGGNAGGTGGANTTLQYPDETALLFGGRYGEHFGGLTELAIMPNGGGGAEIAQSKMSYVFDTDSGPVALDLFSGALGAAWAFADPSNAVRHNTRSSQSRAFALENTVMMNSGVTGLGVHTLLNDSVYLAAGLVAAADLNGAVMWADTSQLSPYLRAAYIADVGGLEAVFGAFYTSLKPAIAGGTAAVNSLIRTANAAKQYGIDLQLQGDIGDMSIGFYLPWVLKGEQVAATGLLNAAPTSNITGTQPMINLALGHLGFKLGYDYAKTEVIGGVAGATSTRKQNYIGVWYSVAQNLELDLAHTITKVDTNAVGVTAATSTSISETQLVIEYVY